MMNKKLIVLMMLMAINLTLNAFNHASTNPVATDSHDEGRWLVALDKDDNSHWIDLEENHTVYFSLYQYTNWNYYDQTGSLYVKTYFVIDGKRYIAQGLDYNKDVIYEDDIFKLTQSAGYMHWYVGYYYPITILYTYYYDDDGCVIEVPDEALIQAGQPAGYWEDYLILIDKNGNEIEKEFGMSDNIDVALDEATYGTSDVYFHFRRVSGSTSSPSTFLGAEVDGLAATSGVPYANKVVRNTTNNFKVPAGYHYKIGIFEDYFGDNYLYLLKGELVDSFTKRGDVNGDSNVTIDDVTALIDYLLSGAKASAGADCNQDGSVTIDDVTTLIDYLLSGSW